MKLVVFGGRDFTDAAIMIRVLQELHQQGFIPEDPELVCGMARGADHTAYELWKAQGMIIHEMPADWDDLTHPDAVIKRSPKGGKPYDAMAGFRRNRQMAEIADKGVGFWNGQSPGTKQMIDAMARLEKPCHVHCY